MSNGYDRLGLEKKLSGGEKGRTTGGGILTKIV